VRSVGGVRYTTVVPDDVLELLLTEAALDKLGARTISADEVGSCCATPTSWYAIHVQPAQGAVGY
jgi:hypothetical protein